VKKKALKLQMFIAEEKKIISIHFILTIPPPQGTT